MSETKRQDRLEEVRAHIARLGITEQDIAEAVAWVRAQPPAEDVDNDVSALIRKYRNSAKQN